MSDDIPTDDQVDAWFANKRSIPLEDYLKRGRRFKEKEIEPLKERWVELRIEMYNFDRTNGQELSDIEAEFELRGEELPMGRVAKETDAFGEKLRGMLEKKKGEPGWHEEWQDDLEADLAAFVHQIKNPDA